MKELFFRKVLRSYYETRRNKRRGSDQMAFESDFAYNLLAFFWGVFYRVFRITRNYAFLTSVPRWREIMATFFEGRLADYMLCSALMPYIDRELSDRTYNNRIGKGGMAAVNQVIEDIYEVTEGYTKPARVIKLDISGCFPSALWDVMARHYMHIIDRYEKEIDTANGNGYSGFLRWLVRICIYCYPTEHCVLRTPPHYWLEHISRDKSLFVKLHGVGAPIGRLVIQHAMGMYLNPIVVYLNRDCGIRTVLFVDDFTLVVPERLHGYALSLIPVLRVKLGEMGMRLNERKFYDQPYQHGLELLGSHIKPYRIHLNNKTYNRAMARVAEFNAVRKKDRIGCLEQFLCVLNSYTGMLKAGTDYKRLTCLVQSVDEEWMKLVYWDGRRQCFRAWHVYCHHALLAMKYGRNIILPPKDGYRIAA